MQGQSLVYSEQRSNNKNVFYQQNFSFCITNNQAKQRSTGRHTIQVRDDDDLDQSDNSEGAKNWILKRIC